MVMNRFPTTPLVIGHRGASADHPENTVAAFRGAVAQGADWVELDVRLNRVGELVVHHDPHYGDGRSVWSTPLAEAPEGTVDLGAALDACGSMGVNVEVKNSPGDLGDAPYHHEVVDAVAELLVGRRAAQPEVDLLVSCFDLPTLDRFRAAATGVPTGYLVLDAAAEADLLARTADGGHDAVHPWDPFVTAALLEECARRGLRCNTWTVDDLDRAAELARLGVDGIVTNVPGRLRAALG